VKLHIWISIWPVLILSAKVTSGTVSDISQLSNLLDGAEECVVFGDVCLDAGYLARKVTQGIDDRGGVPIIKLKKNVKSLAKGVAKWKWMVRFARKHPSPYKRRYGKRSIIEGVIAAVKQRFGERIYSKKRHQQRIELLMKLLIWDAMALLRVI